MKRIVRTLVTAALATLALGCSKKDSNNSIELTNTKPIIGGTDVAEGSALQRSIVGIFDVERNALCTGSLLENNVVLTAAHCIGRVPRNHVIIFASDMISILTNNDIKFALAHLRPAVKTIVNPEWNDGQQGDKAWGDTALIKFEGPLPEGYAPAKLLAPNSLTEGATVVVAGYGVNSDIVEAVDPKDHADFNDKVKSGEFFCELSEDGKSTGKCFQETLSGEGHLRTTELALVGAYNDTEVVFDQQHGKASCEGDSGGPAYLMVNGEYHLFGVTSRGGRGCNTFVVYSDVSSPKLSAWLATAKAQLEK